MKIQLQTTEVQVTPLLKHVSINVWRRRGDCVWLDGQLITRNYKELT